MSSAQANDPLPESSPPSGNRNSTDQESYEVGDAQNVLPASRETSLQGQTYLTQGNESPGDDELEPPQLSENDGSMYDLDGALTQGGTTDRAESGGGRTPRAGTQSVLIQDWSFDPSTTQRAAPNIEDLIVQSYGLDNDIPRSEGDSGTTTLPTNLPNTGTPTSSHQSGNLAVPANTRGATSSADPDIQPGRTSSGTGTVPGLASTARTSQQFQRHRDNLPLSSPSYIPALSGFLSNEPSRSRQRSQRPGEGSAERASNIEPSFRITLSRVESAVATLANQVKSLEQKVDDVLTKTIINESINNKLDVVAVDSETSNISLNRIVGILENSTHFQETSNENFRTINQALETYNGNITGMMAVWHEVNTRMHHYSAGLHDFGRNLHNFKHAWDVNRRLVNSYQELILSLISWLEPPALFFRNLGRVFGYLAFWQGLRSGASIILALATGNQDNVDADNNEEHGSGGNGIHGAGQGVNEGAEAQQNPFAHQAGGEQQPAGNQIGAQPGPAEHNGIKKALRTCWSYFLLIVFLLCVHRIIIAPPSRFRNRPDTHQQISLAAPMRGAYPIAPAMLVLLQSQNDARIIAELASKSAESVVACANLARDGSHERVGFFKSWFGRLKMDPEGKCRRAVSLSTEAAMKVKILAIKLEWVFGGDWWLTSDGKARTAEMGSYGTETAVIETATAN